MNGILGSLAALFPSALAGYALLHVIDRKRTLFFIEKCALGFGLGLGCLSWTMLCSQLAGIRYSLVHLAVPLAFPALTVAVTFLGNLRIHHGKFPPPRQKLLLKGTSLRGWDYVLLIGIGFEMAHAFFRAWIRPMEAYDAVSNWGLKAKAIYLASGIPIDFLQNPDYREFHPDYPPLVPLLESAVYQFLGTVNDTASKTLFPLFLLSCVTLFWACLRRAELPPSRALAFTFMLSSIPYFTSQATNGYADGVVSFYFGAGSLYLYLYLWHRSRDPLLLVISALLTGLATLTKNEGILLAGIQSLVLGLVLASARDMAARRSRLKIFAAHLGILSAILLPWFLLRVDLNLANDVTSGAVLRWSQIGRLGSMLYFYQTQVFGLRNWNLVWILFLGLLVWNWRGWLHSSARPLILTVLLALVAYNGIYMITPHDVMWHLRTSGSRLLLHILPQVMFLIALAFEETGKKP
jgi:hypothetical protein